MKAINENNKVFELIDYLFERKGKIENYYKIVKKHKLSWRDAHSKKPKHKLADETEYKEALNTANEVSENLNRISKQYHDKLNVLSFEHGYSSYKSQIKSIIEAWINDIGYSQKNEAIELLKTYRIKFNELQTENIILFLEYCLFPFFFDDLSYILNETFDKYLEPKYSGLSKALEPYLEGASDDVIESIIDEHKLPHGAVKPKWKRNADGARFGKYVGLENRQLRELFDNDIRTNNIPPDANRNNEIRNILLRYKVPQAKQE